MVKYITQTYFMYNFVYKEVMYFISIYNLILIT